MALGYRNDERTYTVLVEDLLGHLERNREEHREIVEEAQAAFRAEAIRRMDQMLADARSGKPIQTSLGLKVPRDHTDAFDTSIGLLKMTLQAGEERVEITSDEYERFVQNRWEWTEGFVASTAPYSTKVGR